MHIKGLSQTICVPEYEIVELILIIYCLLLFAWYLQNQFPLGSNASEDLSSSSKNPSVT